MLCRLNVAEIILDIVKFILDVADVSLDLVLQYTIVFFNFLFIECCEQIFILFDLDPVDINHFGQPWHNQF